MIFLKKDLGQKAVQYMRLNETTGGQYVYLLIVMQGETTLSSKESLIDKAAYEKLLADPAITGCNPVLFHGRTGLPWA